MLSRSDNCGCTASRTERCEEEEAEDRGLLAVRSWLGEVTVSSTSSRADALLVDDAGRSSTPFWVEEEEEI